MNKNLHYISKGSGKHLVFQHGLTADARQIDSLIGDVPDIHLICMDCPGHGLSSLSQDQMVSFDNYTDKLISLMDRLEIDKTIVGGLSMGSGIAINMSIRYPERVTALILLRPAWLDTPQPENLRIINQAAEYLAPGKSVSDFMLLEEFRNIEAENQGAAKSILGIFGDHQQEVLKRVIHDMYLDCPIKDLSNINKINKPCLILANDDDPLHPFEMAEIIFENMRGSILKKLTSRYIDAELHGSQVKASISTFLNTL